MLSTVPCCELNRGEACCHCSVTPAGFLGFGPGVQNLERMLQREPELLRSRKGHGCSDVGTADGRTWLCWGQVALPVCLGDVIEMQRAPHDPKWEGWTVL
jgi:hypothetical protein